MSNGVVLYHGPSMLDGSPIVVIATGIKGTSKNAKTGDMVQTWILRADVSPMEAINSGADASICGACTHRGQTVYVELPQGGVSSKNINRSCYVTVFQAPLNVWKTWKRGGYPDAAVGVLDGRNVRLGAYGDPAAVPVSVWSIHLNGTAGHTGYTHQWRTMSGLKGLVMASCDTPQDYIDAKAMGWRTFRVRSADEPLAKREIVCPASDEGGKRTECAACKLCAGASKSAADIAIIAHGAASKVNAFTARNHKAA